MELLGGQDLAHLDLEVDSLADELRVDGLDLPSLGPDTLLVGRVAQEFAVLDALADDFAAQLENPVGQSVRILVSLSCASVSFSSFRRLRGPPRSGRGPRKPRITRGSERRRGDPAS